MLIDLIVLQIKHEIFFAITIFLQQLKSVVNQLHINKKMALLRIRSFRKRDELKHLFVVSVDLGDIKPY